MYDFIETPFFFNVGHYVLLCFNDLNLSFTWYDGGGFYLYTISTLINFKKHSSPQTLQTNSFFQPFPSFTDEFSHTCSCCMHECLFPIDALQTSHKPYVIKSSKCELPFAKTEKIDNQTRGLSSDLGSLWCCWLCAYRKDKMLSHT